MKGTDFVFVWIAPPGDAFAREDLKYAMRSLEASWVGNMRVTVVGDDPKFTGQIWHAPHERIESDLMPKALDAVRKMEAIIGLPYVQDRFVYMYDDTYFLRPVDELWLSRRRAVREVPDGWTGGGSRKHQEALGNTVKCLRDNGFTRIWDYETHMPRFFEKRKMLEVIHLYKADVRRLLLPTLYFNHHYKGQEPEILSPHDDVKVMFKGRLANGVKPAPTTNEMKALEYYRQHIIGKHVWNHNNKGIRDPGLQHLRYTLWPNESSFEAAPKRTRLSIAR